MTGDDGVVRAREVEEFPVGTQKEGVEGEGVSGTRFRIPAKEGGRGAESIGEGGFARGQARFEVVLDPEACGVRRAACGCDCCVALRCGCDLRV